MRYAQLVVGPAGCGKSTYCSNMVEHAATTNRTIHVVNLDPAAEFFNYNPIVDVRDLINLEDVMDDRELHFGPNGGLTYCIEYLVNNLEWLEEELGDVDDDYILFDCPGQIELYTHMTTIKKFAEQLMRMNFRVCVVFLADAQFMTDGAKFLSGTMAALSVMINLELPHINILTKMDQLAKEDRDQLDIYLEPDTKELLNTVQRSGVWGEKYRQLTATIGQIIEDYSLVRFYPLNLKKYGNVRDILLTIDNMLQFGEDADVQLNDFNNDEDEDFDSGIGKDCNV